ncbi:RNA polymerase sigma factor [Sphingobacterium sp. LRF_L2]|uniref:RNA polymerase sigma factor n=1 Tax=Sphingobacterium sp. LRF_L2 TaxID=3369421 RepID=UPI003F5E1E99
MKRYTNYTDLQLSEMLKAGDHAAYTEIYHRYKKLLYLFAFKRLGSKEEVLDVVHEVFLSLWLNHASIQIQYTLSTYLHAAVRNKIANIFAHKQVEERFLESLDNFLTTEFDVSDHLVRHHQLETQIDKEIKALPIKMRKVFELSRISELNRAKIAEELGLSEETVKSHLHKALKRLRAKLGPLINIFL